MAKGTKSRVVHAGKGPNGEILCHRMGCGKLAVWWEDWERWAIKRWLSTAYCDDDRTGPDYPVGSGHSERLVRQPVRALFHGGEKPVEYEVTRVMMPPRTDPVETLTGAQANIRIRGLVVNSMADELWTFEAVDRDRIPMRIVARTQRTEDGGLSGPRVVREVYEQYATGRPVHECDWLERGEYQTPEPKRQPVKVGDRVTAMPDGYSLGPGLVTAIEWKVRPMQSHYALPPLWSWEWRVTVWFGNDSQREGRWHPDWVEKASKAQPGTQESFEPFWQKLEAEFQERAGKDAAETAE